MLVDSEISEPLMSEELKIVFWPDPRLRQVSEPVKEFTPALRGLTTRMFALMRESNGVGLAAPQVGKNIRLFVMNATGKPEDDRVYINPVLSDPDGEESAEEGCLSLPKINAQINRNKSIRMIAQDLEGNPIHETQSGFVARVWQHEFDHLNGVMITDRMGLGDKLKHRKAIQELQEAWEIEHPPAPKKTPSLKSKISSRLKRRK